MTNSQNIQEFETSKFYSPDDLYLFLISWVFGSLIFATSLLSILVNAVFVFIFLGLFFGALYLRKKYVFRDFFHDKLIFNASAKSLQVGQQSIPLKNITASKVWTVRGIDRCLELSIKDQSTVRVLTPKAKQVLQLLN